MKDGILWRRQTALTVFSLVALFLVSSIPVQAAVPLQIPVQGLLRDNAGVPVAEDVFQVTFALYDESEGGDPIWTEIWPPEGGDCLEDPTDCIHVVRGTFQVMLGAHTALDSSVFGGEGALWLGVTVETEPELPRRPLGSAPFALHAGAADNLACTGCVEAEMLSAQARDTLRGEAVNEVQGFGYITEAEALSAVEAAGYATQDDLTITEDSLPNDGLNEFSNGLLSHEFSFTFDSPGAVDIKDDYPLGVASEIQVPDVGVAKGLKLHVEITNSDMSTVTVSVFDPDGVEHTLWAQSGAGVSLVATYPEPDAEASGDLASWNGRNPEGLWILKVVDAGELNDGLDGAINHWSVQVDTVSNKQVQVDGDLVVNGTITSPGGFVVGSGAGGPAPCDAAHAGAIQFDPESQRLTFCTGTELLQLKACSTDCPAASEVSCGQSVKNDCDGLCEGTGTALDPVQCLSKVSTTPCGEVVEDGCGNTCGQTGTALSVVGCSAQDSVSCGDPVSDACGNVCGTAGTAFDPTQCPDADSVTCATPVVDQCGNACGGVGTLCSGSGICGATGCVSVGKGPENPGASCGDILTKNPLADDGVYWVDPDGSGAGGLFEVWCEMQENGGGWALVMRMAADNGLRYHSSHWTQDSTFNDDPGGSMVPTLSSNAKFHAFNLLPSTEIRGCKGSGGACADRTLNGPKTALEAMNGGYDSGGITRGTMVALFGDDPTQPHCNTSGINASQTEFYAAARLGLVANNENSCDSNDSAWGWGVFGSSDQNRSCGAGLSAHGGSDTCIEGTLWVR